MDLSLLDAVAGGGNLPKPNQMLQEAIGSYASPASAPQSDPPWVEVLVDCPGTQDVFLYQVPAELRVAPGDILSVPFNGQQLGAVAIRRVAALPTELASHTIRSVEEVVSRNFFPPHYWTLLHQIAEYYCTPLIQVIRTALPPGLLGRSQRRIRLIPSALPEQPQCLTPAAQKILECLAAKGKREQTGGKRRGGKREDERREGEQRKGEQQEAEGGSYTWQFLQRQIPGARQGLRELTQRGWVESYLEPPTPVRAQQRQSVSLTALDLPVDLSQRQQEVLEVLRRQGGDLWLQELLQRCRVSSSVVKGLEQKGCVVVQLREVLRSEGGGSRTTQDLPKPLTPEQAAAVTAIVQSSTIPSSTCRSLLLHGVTGSGKTEVYLQAIAPLLQSGKSALVLVPEIGLTPQLTDRFRSRFGNQVRLYHSALSEGERYDTWRQMLTGTPQVVIGTRSAIFAPLPHLGLIILDEEHDSSFKQDQPAPCYHARTVAYWRAALSNCPLVLGSATPCLETWVAFQGVKEPGSQGAKESRNQGVEELEDQADERTVGEMRAGEGRSDEEISNGSTPPTAPSEPQIPNPNPPPSPPTAPSKPQIPNPNPPPSNPQLLSLPARIHARPLPPVEVVDMRQELRQGNRSIFSRSLQEALRSLGDRRQQGILFIHRRGHSTFVSCRSCGDVMNCPHCDISLTYHQPQEGGFASLRCHYCGYGRSHPPQCPSCSSPYLKHFGSGTQRVVQELAQELPELRCIRFDSDTTRAKGSHRALLAQFAEGGADLLVGTQMLTKGIDLPQVTLVGVIAADGLLHMADFRAGERAFQVLTQVAGRAGRGEEPGRVILQTYSPDHVVIQAVQQQDYETFVEGELEQRSLLTYPPYSQFILLRFSGYEVETVRRAAEQVAAELRSRLPQCDLLGPTPALVERVARRYRWQLVVKRSITHTNDSPGALVDWGAVRSHCPSAVSLTIDVDPLTLL